MLCGSLFVCALEAYASTFGESCTILPLPSDIAYLENETAYGYIQKNLDMQTYVPDGCAADGTEFSFCIKNEDGASEYCSLATINIGDAAYLGSLNSNPELGGNPMLSNVILEVQQIENDVCLQMPTSRGLMPLLCRSAGNIEDETEEGVNPDGTDVCGNISESCFSQHSKSQLLFDVYGLTVNCVRDALDRVFYIGSECPSTDEEIIYSTLRPFPEFQGMMRNAVGAALIIYVMVYGFKLAMNVDYATKEQVFLFIMKIILVAYFAVGLGPPSFSSGKAIQENGMTGYVLPELINLTNEFTEMVFSATGAQGLCEFDVTKYEEGYEYYKIWDAIGCRVAYYGGMQILYNYGSILKDLTGIEAGEPAGGEPVMSDSGSGSGDAPDAVSDVLNFALIPVLFGFLLAGNIIVVVLGIIFVVMLLSLGLYFITAYLVCMITLYAMAYISPIFITMALFERTKDYFESWLRIVMSCTLQPAIIGGFMALLLTVYDSTIYGNCEFQRFDYEVGDIKFSTFELREPLSEPELCQETLGYKLAKYYTGEGWSTLTLMLFEVSYINDTLNLALSLIYVMIYVFIFYFFMKSISKFASEITGGPDLSDVTFAPDVVIKKLKAAALFGFALAKSVRKVAKGDLKGAKNEMKGAKDKLLKEDITEKRKGGASDEFSLDTNSKDDDKGGMGGGVMSGKIPGGGGGDDKDEGGGLPGMDKMKDLGGGSKK